jgi:hypothetical protein
VCDECKQRQRKGPPYGDEPRSNKPADYCITDVVVERSYLSTPRPSKTLGRFKITEAPPAAEDMIHDPVHYARWPMQPIQFIATNNLPYWLANIIKYACRYDAKDGVQDLYKARSYLNMKIAELEGVPEFWKPREKS